MLTKTEIRIQGISCQSHVKTVTDCLTGLDGVKRAKVNLRKKDVIIKYDSSLVTVGELKRAIIQMGYDVMEKTKSLTVLTTSLASLILMVAVVGCSDVPYTGPILTVDSVDSFLRSTGQDVVCLQDGFDSVCLKIAASDEDDTTDAAILEIYPQDITYLFYYDNKPILAAKRAIDTTELVQESIDSGQLDLPPGSTATPSGNIDNITHGWTIQIYYPDSYPEADRGNTPETSGFNIKVAEGLKINAISKEDELAIKFPLQRDKSDGSRVFEFSVETESTKITIAVDGLVSEHIVKFFIDVDRVAFDEGINRLQLEPK